MPYQHPPIELRSGLPIIPYGHGTPYATVNDLPDWVADAKLPILDKSTGVVSACCWVFHNEGTDFVDLGRPSYLSNLRPGVDSFSVRCVALRRSDNAEVLASWGSPVLQSGRQFQLFCRATTDTGLVSGGVETICAHPSMPINIYHSYIATVNGISTSISIDGIIASGYSGTATSTENFYIGGRTDGASANFEGDTAFLSIKDGAGKIIDVIDFGDTTQWNGGSSGVTRAGVLFTFTDSPPTGIRKKAAIPRNLLVY